MDHATRFPANGPTTAYPQTAAMLASNVIPYDPQLMQIPGTAEHNTITCRILLADISLVDVYLSVQTHKNSKQLGIHHMLDDLLKLTKEQLDQVISANNPQTDPMLASDVIPYDPQLVENPGTAEQNATVRRMLLANMSPADIHSSVQTHEDSKEAGIHHELDHLSNLIDKQLDQVSSANEILLQQPLVKAHRNPKRKMSQDPDDGSAPCPQDAKRPRKASMGRRPIHQKPATNTPRVMPYGCPGDANRCQEHRKRQWTSIAEFVRHVEDNHSDEYKRVDCLGDGATVFVCRDCESNQSLPNSTQVRKWKHLRELAKHIYMVHLIRTKSKLHHTNALEAKDQPEEPADIPHAHSNSTELGNQLQIIANPGMAEVKTAGSLRTRHKYISHTETDNFSFVDIGTNPVV